MTAFAPLQSPVDDALRIGTVTQVTAQSVTINVPNAASLSVATHHADTVVHGEVGGYVCFAHEDTLILGRITRVALPERDRLRVEPTIGDAPSVDPLAEIALLTDIDVTANQVTGAVGVPPRIGEPAYAVSAAMLQWVVEATARSGEGEPRVSLRLGQVPGISRTPVVVSPERLFGRHCAVLGVTGAGKSWTIARIVEECARYRSKVVLIDATGEFKTLGGPVEHCSIGREIDEPDSSTEASCPFHALEERDLFALFRPAGQSQAPVLREAIRSLKLAHCADLPEGMVDDDGCIRKKAREQRGFYKQYKDHEAQLERRAAWFDVEQLASQIQHECVYPTDKFDPSRWGDVDHRAIGYCIPLVMRVHSMVRDKALAPILRPRDVRPIQGVIDRFLADPQRPVLRISLRFMSFEQSVRPIVANAIGRHLLEAAREGALRANPTLVLLDEAHQFLNKRVGDESVSYTLDGFDLIAKEGRKYGLTVCLATQRPRDIQEGVLSQMGTMIVHRLTHGADRDVVERSARDVEKSVAGFLPTLAPGQALLIGADFPVPIPIQIRAPTTPPDSSGPDYQSRWAADSSP